MPLTQLAYPSPKRKRDQPPPVPLLNTALQTISTPSRASSARSPSPDSPRNAVANQLRGMTLAVTSAISMSPLTPTDDVIRKKPKLDEMRVDSATSLQLHANKDKNISWRNGNSLDTMTVMASVEGLREIPETPQSQPRMSPDIASFANPTTFVSSDDTLASHQSVTTHQGSRTMNRPSSQPRSHNRSPSPPLSLTWQDSEITGHLVNPATDPDDDGTGLNGIGFRPTPAMAYARSQKRRQQLNEWKARETREARAKRQERRRRGTGGTASREATVERDLSPKIAKATSRTVKFAV